MKILFIGAKPQDLGGFKGSKLQDNIKLAIQRKIVDHIALDDNFSVLTSLSLGIEVWAAETALKNKIDIQVYVPFDNPESKWFAKDQQNYKYLLGKAKKKIIVDTGGFEGKKLLAKDQKMVQDADVIYTFFANAIPLLNFANRQNKNMVDLMPRDAASNDVHIPL